MSASPKTVGAGTVAERALGEVLGQQDSATGLRDSFWSASASQASREATLANLCRRLLFDHGAAMNDAREVFSESDAKTTWKCADEALWDVLLILAGNGQTYRDDPGRRKDAIAALVVDDGPGVCCGHVFNPGELVYHCVDCAADATCVFCQKCFMKANHQGHTVKYHRSEGGGVCDCGDEEAWKPEGFCCDHRGMSLETARTSAVSKLSTQAGLLLTHLVRGVLDLLVAHAENLPHHFNNVQRFEEGAGGSRYVVGLHNDDVHTYQQVSAIVKRVKRCGDAEAMGFTTQVDKLGFIELLEGTAAEIRPSLDALVKVGLLYSVRTVDEYDRASAMAAGARFLAELAQKSTAGREIISQYFCEPGAAGANPGSAKRRRVGEAHLRPEESCSASAKKGEHSGKTSSGGTTAGASCPLFKLMSADVYFSNSIPISCRTTRSNFCSA